MGGVPAGRGGIGGGFAEASAKRGWREEERKGATKHLIRGRPQETFVMLDRARRCGTRTMRSTARKRVVEILRRCPLLLAANS